MGIFRNASWRVSGIRLSKELDPEDSYLVALPSNPEEGSAAPRDFIAHVDTADFNAENIDPQIHENYNWEDVLLNAEKNLVTTVSEFVWKTILAKR